MENQELQNKNQEQQSTENPMIKKRWFGRGIYGSKDVPIRVLDGFIGAAILAIAAMIVFFTIKGGFWVTFDSQGGSEVEKQKVKHGELIEEPQTPVKPGYVFEGWQDEEENLDWDFRNFMVESDMTLTAKWAPAEILVKFDLDGGSLVENTEEETKKVTFGEKYGRLPIPEKEGYTFAGWFYSGSEITEDTQVLTSGEHILTAQWK